MDVDSGKPVAGAEVVATNRFRIGDGPERTTAQGSISEADGVAVLPPLRTGSVTLVGRARGYIESEPLVLPVDEEQGLESAVIQLRAEPEGDQLLCRLWDGRPAVNALVIAVASDLSDIVLWRSSTDADGGVRVPSTLSGAVLLISHEHAAGLARPWTRPNHDETVMWNLSPPAPPIAVRVTDAFDRPVRMAHMVLWVDGIPLRGMALRFLSGAAPFSDGDGFWHATNLGGQTYRALATRTFLLPIPETLAQTILYQASNDIPTRLIVLP
jgi:hypothetical protein